MRTQDNSELQEQLGKLVEDFQQIEVNNLSPNKINLKQSTKAMLCLHITTMEELEFIETLLTHTSKVGIEAVVPIENVYKSIGTIPLVFDTLIKIRSYNPRIVMEIINGDQHITLTNSDILCL